ncbi:DUF4190 domain-containing protein [Candidatus Saccharibacteria bacterium]|nr:DUF4190 domain-containing protein [Candidatus Saccharibacteria bacterium]
MDENPSKEAPASENGAEKTTSNPKKALSIVALVFGILGLISCAGGPIALVLCLVGVICGIVALVKKQQKGMAIAGLVCGAVGIIPALLFSFLWGGLASLIGQGIDACKDDPSCSMTINGKSIDYDLNKDSKKDDSSDTKKDNTDDTKKTDTDNTKKTDTDNTKKTDTDNTNKNSTSSATGWTYDYLKELAEEKGGKISDVPQEYIDAFKDFEVCLADEGFKISSWKEFESLSDDTDDMTMDQALGLMGCAMALSKATEDVDSDIDLDL